MTVLDLTSLPPHIADAMVKPLGEPDRDSIRWWAMHDEHAYIAETHHQVAGIDVTAFVVAEFTELLGDDWRSVIGLTSADWADYENWMREAA